MTHMAGGRGTSCVRHYDALRTKIDMLFTPKENKKNPEHSFLDIDK